MQEGSLTTVFPGDFELNFSIFNFAAPPALIVTRTYSAAPPPSRLTRGQVVDAPADEHRARAIRERALNLADLAGLAPSRREASSSGRA
jgi:hypothetical protein